MYPHVVTQAKFAPDYVKNPDSDDHNHKYYTMVISYLPVAINNLG